MPEVQQENPNFEKFRRAYLDWCQGSQSLLQARVHGQKANEVQLLEFVTAKFEEAKAIIIEEARLGGANAFHDLTHQQAMAHEDMYLMGAFRNDMLLALIQDLQQ